MTEEMRSQLIWVAFGVWFLWMLYGALQFRGRRRGKRFRPSPPEADLTVYEGTGASSKPLATIIGETIYEGTGASSVPLGTISE